jgi:tetratricopeptide (TPR) repeat protein
MKRILGILILLVSVTFASLAQNEIKVEAPGVVAVDEQFNVTFIIEGEKEPTDFSWTPGDDFQLVWGPQKGSSRSVQIINGKRTSSSQTTYTYILIPKSKGTFSIPSATAKLKGDEIHSASVSIQVVSDGSSSGSNNQSSGSQGNSQANEQTVTGDISGNDLFMKLSLSKSEAVVGEPITASLKLYQRVNIAGFENAKFPTFNGFWSQETYSPTNIEFKRESYDDKIYNTAVLRSYVLIPQQAGTITIDPAELVCLVNIRVNSGSSGSIFDSFFQDDYRTIRKRVVTPALKVKVNPLPAGQPASYGGGVGNFGISARLTSDNINTHDAASLIVTISGRGNVALLEAPKVNFPPDFEVYDTKTTENTDKSTGGTSGSKTFEFPFIPRSHGDFTIPPIEYSYYDVNAGKYVTLHTEPLKIKVAKGKGGDSNASNQSSLPSVERSGVKNISNDIRFISTKKPSFTGGNKFFLGSAGFWVILAILLGGTLALVLAGRKMAARKADVAGAKNRRATKMALGRLKHAQEYLDKNLYSAYYEELHKALLGYISDKLNMDMSEINKDNIKSELVKGGASAEQADKFIGLLDACEFARYSPDAGSEEMKNHFSDAVESISSIDSSLKGHRSKGSRVGGAAIIAIFLCLGLSIPSNAEISNSEQRPDGSPLTLTVQDSSTSKPSYSVVPDTSASVVVDTLSGDPDALWEEGVKAFNDNKFVEAASCWESIYASGKVSPELFYNLGNAYFKQGNYPRAVLNYERALKMDPSYKDARYNLDFTSNFVQDKIEPVPELILKTFARNISRIFASNTWAWLFIVFLAFTLAMVVIFIMSPKHSSRKWGFFLGILFLILSLCCLGFSAWQKADSSKSDDAIVMAPVTSVKSSPSDDGGKNLFILHEGSKVQIIDEVGGWKNISLADGRQGWIKDSDLEII